MALDIGQRIPSLAAGLAATGAGPARVMTVAEVAAALRVAYDPSVAKLIEDVARRRPGSNGKMPARRAPRRPGTTTATTGPPVSAG